MAAPGGEGGAVMGRHSALGARPSCMTWGPHSIFIRGTPRICVLGGKHAGRQQEAHWGVAGTCVNSLTSPCRTGQGTQTYPNYCAKPGLAYLLLITMAFEPKLSF